MTEIHKRYRLTSTEEPTDEMLQALMEDVAAEARKSMANAEAEHRRRLQAVALEFLHGGPRNEHQEAYPMRSGRTEWFWQDYNDHSAAQ